MYQWIIGVVAIRLGNQHDVCSWLHLEIASICPRSQSNGLMTRLVVQAVEDLALMQHTVNQLHCALGVFHLVE
jgi:hypothetical protein